MMNSDRRSQSTGRFSAVSSYRSMLGGMSRSWENRFGWSGFGVWAMSRSAGWENSGFITYIVTTVEDRMMLDLRMRPEVALSK